MVLILRWRSEPQRAQPAARRTVRRARCERGMATSRCSRTRLKVVMLRIFVFFIQSYGPGGACCRWWRAGLHGGGPSHLHGDAVLRRRGRHHCRAAISRSCAAAFFSRDDFVRYRHADPCAICQRADRGWCPKMWVALPAMVIDRHGLDLGGQFADGVSAAWRMPDWVRARGMSIYQAALMGGSATGALLWGQMAELDQRAHQRDRWRLPPSAWWRCCSRSRLQHRALAGGDGLHARGAQRHAA